MIEPLNNMAELSHSKFAKYIRWGAIALFAASVGILIYFIKTTFIILALSYFIAYILNPFIEKFESHRISRFWAIWLAGGLALIISVLIFLILVPQVTEQASAFKSKAPKWKKDIVSWIIGDANQSLQIQSASPELQINGEISSESVSDEQIASSSAINPATQNWWETNPFVQNNVIPLIKEINENLTNKPIEETTISDYAKTIWEQIKEYRDELWNTFVNAIRNTYQGVAGIIVGILNFIMLPVFTFYFLLDYKRINHGFYDLLPPQWRIVVKDWLGEIDGVLGSFIRGQFTIACILALIYSVGLSILQVPMGAVIGIIAGMANMVPYMSIVIGLIPALLFALIENADVMQLLWVMILFVGGQMFEGLYLSPRIMSGEVGLHPVAVIVAIIVGGTLFGLAGVILAVPVTAVLKVIFIRLHKQWQTTWVAASE